jgi:CMP-N-acetylneuraminic acid synthetase/spore coat polysaccharide biosynthesis predicted glycosyltransferase SpsG
VNILAIIPARGNSKGIPRKNLRNLAGKPLIYYAISMALKSRFNLDVYVSSDDDEILYLSSTFGAKTYKRGASLSSDEVTLDPVIYDAYHAISKLENKEYDIVVTLQPTSPVLSTHTFDSALEHLLDNNLDTLISAKKDVHLTWKNDGTCFVPNYKERLNRQYLEPSYRETGGFLMTKTDCISINNRIGSNVDLFLLENGEEIDIDDYEDWSICEYYLNKKNILFVVTGNQTFGLGHVYNTLIMASDITRHRVSFMVDSASQLAFEKIKEKHFSVSIQKSENLLDDVLECSPDIVINDKLSNSREYVQGLKSHGIKVINVEDTGEGAMYADLVINAIYSSKEFLRRHYFGHEYYILRDEFILTEPRTDIAKKITNVLISFGGTDPNNLTYKVLNAIYDYCICRDIEINVVAGIGYSEYDSLQMFEKVKIHKNIAYISKYMLQADVIFAAMGRTLYEIASLGIPSILFAQNERELSHTFGYGENGFFNLGLHNSVTDEMIIHTFETIQSFDVRKQANLTMLKFDLRSGRKRVNQLIKGVIEA